MSIAEKDEDVDLERHGDEPVEDEREEVKAGEVQQLAPSRSKLFVELKEVNGKRSRKRSLAVHAEKTPKLRRSNAFFGGVIEGDIYTCVENDTAKIIADKYGHWIEGEDRIEGEDKIQTLIRLNLDNNPAMRGLTKNARLMEGTKLRLNSRVPIPTAPSSYDEGEEEEEEEEVKCDYCGGLDGKNKDNQIFLCDGAGCNMSIHRECPGGPKNWGSHNKSMWKSLDWYCPTCADGNFLHLGERNTACYGCGMRIGLLFKETGNRWYHKSCSGMAPPKKRKSNDGKDSKASSMASSSSQSVSQSKQDSEDDNKRSNATKKNHARQCVWIDFFGDSHVGNCPCCNVQMNKAESGWHCAHIDASRKMANYAEPHVWDVWNLVPLCNTCNLENRTDCTLDFMAKSGSTIRRKRIKSLVCKRLYSCLSKFSCRSDDKPKIELMRVKKWNLADIVTSVYGAKLVDDEVFGYGKECLWLSPTELAKFETLCTDHEVRS